MAGSPRFTVYGRWGNGLFELTDVLAATWTQAINELDTLEIKTRQAVAKGNAIVWQDSKGIWHEHLVSSVEAEHSTASTAPVNTVYAENSLCEIRGDYVVNKRPGVGVTGGATASEALAAALSASRWSVGAVDVATKASASLYHTTAWDALSDVVGAWGGEIETALTAGTSGITARKLNLKAKIGQASATRRFEYTRDMSSVKRAYDDTDVITAVYAWGKGEELDSGGYGRRIGIASVNGGVDYVADADALALWGRPDGNGGKAHVFGDYTNEDQEDAAALKVEAEAYLAGRCAPEITYTADVLQFGAAGVDLTGVSLGDAVHVVDTSFEPELRIEARIVGMKTDLLDPYNPTITLGNYTRGLEEQFASIKSTLGGISNRAATWEAMESAAAGYLNRVIDGLNDIFASSGGFVSFDPASGITVTDKDTVEASTMAVNISGAGIRIADSKTSAGGWDWRTFGTGAGFTADEINAGTLTAIRIQDATGENYWDLATGEMHLKSAVPADEAVSSVSVLYAVGGSASETPTSGWSTDTPEWSEGKYVWQKTVATMASGTVNESDPVCIQGARGEKGEDGAQGEEGAKGVGVSAIVSQYYLSTSDTAQTGGTWSESEPAWSSGHYIWARSKVTWTDGNTTTTSPTLATTYNAIAKAQTELATTVDGIQSSVSKIEGDYVTSTTLNQTSSSLTAKINTAQTTADNAKKVATNYLSFSGNGLVVGDMTASSLGSNVRLNSSGMEVRNGATVLASYGANSIKLGANSASSTVEMCGGRGKIYVGNNRTQITGTNGVVLVGESNSQTSNVGIISDSTGPMVMTTSERYSLGGDIYDRDTLKSRIAPYIATAYASTATSLTPEWRPVRCYGKKVYKEGKGKYLGIANGCLLASAFGFLCVSGAIYWQDAYANDAIQMGLYVGPNAATISGGTFYPLGGNAGYPTTFGTITAPMVVVPITINPSYVFLVAANWSGTRGTIPSNDATQITGFFLR